MSAFCVCNISVHSPELFSQYRLLAQQSISAHAGQYLVRGGELEVVEGTWQPNRLVIGQFASMEALKNWYKSKEYREARAIRDKSASTNMVFVQGWTP